VNFLLDTNILIWAAISLHKISSELARLLSDPSNHLYFSSASIWETSVKESLGKRDFHVSSNKLHEG
jgi:PIN domain nuclease of toxin-antitoxin system